MKITPKRDEQRKKRREAVQSFEVKWSLPLYEKPAPKERTGSYYQQEFPELITRPLTPIERSASAQRGFIRRDRRRKNG